MLYERQFFFRQIPAVSCRFAGRSRRFSRRTSTPQVWHLDGCIQIICRDFRLEQRPQTSDFPAGQPQSCRSWFLDKLNAWSVKCGENCGNEGRLFFFSVKHDLKFKCSSNLSSPYSKSSTEIFWKDMMRCNVTYELRCKNLNRQMALVLNANSICSLNIPQSKLKQHRLGGVEWRQQILLAGCCLNFNMMLYSRKLRRFIPFAIAFHFQNNCVSTQMQTQNCVCARACLRATAKVPWRISYITGIPSQFDQQSTLMSCFLLDLFVSDCN